MLRGTREEIVEQLAQIEGKILDVVVHIDGPDPAYPPMTDEEEAAFFAEMDRLAAAEGTDAGNTADNDYSREAIYREYPGE